ncbi:MAG: hypothetical protein KAH32_06660 [Chlamydiia bacterium]|nr:hypothetical protein [Chlamydiia bacterium]
MRHFRWIATSLVAIVSFLAFTSCEKEIAANSASEVSFVIQNPSYDNDKKDSSADYPKCVDGTASYVLTTIDGEEYKLNILTNLEDGNQTVVVKLDAKKGYVVSSFLVYDDMGTPDDVSDDVLLWAAPMEGSTYAERFNLNGLNVTFNVEAFTKKKVEIDVLCFEEVHYLEFGFIWFQFHEYKIKSICFFGDVCTKFYENWIDSEYYEGNGYDMVARFRVSVEAPNGEIIESDNFLASETENNLVCIEYVDNLAILDETFKAKIFLQLPDGNETLIHELEFTDSDWTEVEGLSSWGETQSQIDGDKVEDGIFEFVVGNCNYDGNEINIELPPYLYLPDSGEINVIYTNLAEYEYFDVVLIGDSWNNDLYPDELFEDSRIHAWCGDLYNGIEEESYLVNVYHSVENDVPGEYNYDWGALNWLANNDELIENMLDSGVWENDRFGLQHTIWLIVHGISDETIKAIENETNHFVDQNMIDLATMAMENSDFIPAPGEYSLLLFDPVEGEGKKAAVPKDGGVIQLVLVRVDP